jgi:UrcA family protein
MIRIATLTAVAAAGLFTLVGAASAQEFQVRPSIAPGSFGQDYQTNVSLNGLDMSREGDARVALERIGRAATAVCGGEPDESSWDEDKESFETCHSQSVRRAVAAAHTPMLTALMLSEGSTLAKN